MLFRSNELHSLARLRQLQIFLGVEGSQVPEPDYRCAKLFHLTRDPVFAGANEIDEVAHVELRREALV